MRNVVIFDHQPELASFLQSQLSLKGHQVKVLFRPSDGLLSLGQDSPAVAIVESHDLLRHGMAVARQRREDVSLRDTRFLLLTAFSERDSLVEDLAIADDYLGKPFEKRELVARVEGLLRLHAPERTLRGQLEPMGGAASVLQMVVVSNLQGALIFEDGLVLYFRGGHIIHTQHPQGSGEHAVREAIARKQGAFRFEPGLNPSEATMMLDPTRLLLEDSAKLKPLDTAAVGMTVVPNLAVAEQYLTAFRGRERFGVTQHWSETHNVPCLRFAGKILVLVVLNSTLEDLSPRLQALLEAPNP